MKLHLWGAIAIISIYSMMLTSCDIDNSDKSDEQRATVADTHWQLSEIYTNSGWLTPAVYSDFDIKDLWFGATGQYQMTLYNYEGDRATHTFSGTYSINSGNIDFMHNNYPGQMFTLSIVSMDKTVIEGSFTIWGDPSVTHQTDGSTIITGKPTTYTIRLKQMTNLT